MRGGGRGETGQVDEGSATRVEKRRRDNGGAEAERVMSGKKRNEVGEQKSGVARARDG